MRSSHPIALLLLLGCFLPQPGLATGVMLHEETVAATATQIELFASSEPRANALVTYSIFIKAMPHSPLASDNALVQAVTMLVIPESADVNYGGIRVSETGDVAGGGYVPYRATSQSAKDWFTLLEAAISKLPYISWGIPIGTWEAGDPRDKVDLNAYDLVAVDWNGQRGGLVRNVKIDIPVRLGDETTVGLYAYWQSKANNEDWSGPTHVRDNAVSPGFDLVRTTRALPASDGLVAHYPLDGSNLAVVRDATGNRHDGMNHGVTACTDRFGNASSAQRFDEGTRVRVSDDGSLWGEEFTLAAWVRLEDLQGFQTIAEAWNSAEGCGVNMFYQHDRSGTRRFWFQLRVGGANYDVNPLAGDFGFGAWHFFAHAYDGDTQRAYIDGVLVGSNRVGRVFHAPRADFFIGDTSYYSGRHMRGSVDDVMIFDRALSQPEVEALYRSR